MVRIEGKKSVLLFLVFLYLPSIPLFLLSGTNDFSTFISTMVYLTLGIACIVILGAWLKSDDKYYRNFSGKYLLVAIITGLGMIALSWTISLSLKNPDMLLSVSNTNGLAVVAMPSSVGTLFLSTLLYGLVMAATSEELFKLTMFAEGRKRWLHGYKLGKITIPGVLVYVGVPVGFWSALHAISAYSDPIMVLPAAVNGIVLIIVLWRTQSIICVIAGHWIYNSGITAITVLNGTFAVPSGLPILPNIFSSQYFSNSAFISDALTFFLLLIAVLFFLLPSLTSKRGSR